MAKAPVPTPVQGDSKSAEAVLAQAEDKVVEPAAGDAEAGTTEPAVANAAEAESAKLDQALQGAEALIEVRVLHDHLDFVSNSVVALSDTEANAAVAAGWADASPEAVAFAKAQAEA